MTTSDELKFIVTARTRLLKYGPGKDPERDEPDEVRDGEPITWIGPPAREIVEQLSAGFDVYVDRDRQVTFIERPPGSGPGAVRIVPEIIREQREKTEEEN